MPAILAPRIAACIMNSRRSIICRTRNIHSTSSTHLTSRIRSKRASMQGMRHSSAALTRRLTPTPDSQDTRRHGT